MGNSKSSKVPAATTARENATAAKLGSATGSLAVADKGPVLLLIQKNADVRRGAELILTGPAPRNGGVIQFSFAETYDVHNYVGSIAYDARSIVTNNGYKTYTVYTENIRARAARDIGSSGDSAVLDILADAISKSTVKGLHVRFAFCNLSSGAASRLASAIRSNANLKGVSCFQNPYNFPDNKYDTESDNGLIDAVLDSNAPIEIWNNLPVAPFLERPKQLRLDYARSTILMAIPETKVFHQLSTLKVLDIRGAIDVSAGEMNGKLVSPSEIQHIREVAAVSWRWEQMAGELSSLSQPDVVRRIALEIRKLGYNFAWIDWCCIPQFSRGVLEDVVNNSEVYSVVPVVILSLTSRFDLHFEYPTRLWTNMELFRALTRPGANMFTCCPDEVEEIKLCGLIKHVMQVTWADAWEQHLHLCLAPQTFFAAEVLCWKLNNPQPQLHNVTALSDPVIRTLLTFTMEKYKAEYQTGLKRTLLSDKLMCAAKVDYLRTVRTLLGKESSYALSTLFQTYANADNAGFLTNLLIYFTDKNLQLTQTFEIDNANLQGLRVALDSALILGLSIDTAAGWVRLQVADEIIACRSANGALIFSAVQDKQWIPLSSPVSLVECWTSFHSRKTKTGYQLVWQDSEATEKIANVFVS